MTISEYFKIALSNFFKNLHSMFKYNIEKDAVQQDQLQKQIINLQNDLLLARKEIINLYFKTNKEDSENYRDELDYFNSFDDFCVFPYKQVKNVKEPIHGFDDTTKLPFVVHNNKRLFFPESWTPEQAKEKYKYYIEKENLLGGGYTTKAPHQYITDNFKVEKGDIVLDVGCAEALFALDSIERTKHTYLFEFDKQWIKPLQATFAPYHDKATIIPKYVGRSDSENTISLESFFSSYKNESFFIKMDIEGAEEDVISSCTNFLSSDNNIKIACCTYHRANHSKTISKLLRKHSFFVDFSNGYMLFPYDKNQQPPYFRNGLIRAYRKSLP